MSEVLAYSTCWWQFPWLANGFYIEYAKQLRLNFGKLGSLTIFSNVVAQRKCIA